jgi:hypothetical protein
MQTYIENTPPGPRAQADREAITGWGADLDHANRPAYPMERTPPRLDNVHWDQPSAQPVNVEVLVSTERPGISPVFGTTLPPRGVSGVIRRLAFKTSENDVRRWLLLLLADRIDVVEGIVQDLAQGHVPNVLAEMGMSAEWRHNRRALLGKLLLLASLATAAALVAKTFRTRDEDARPRLSHRRAGRR